MRHIFKTASISILILMLLTPIAVKAETPEQTHKGDQSVVLAGGCFWGMQSVFDHVKGVKSVTAGYAGGPASDANYETVSTGTTGHAEAVKVTYDPSQVSFADLLSVYFKVAHDPTELNYQGPDHGTQYRSAIFYTTPEQEQVAQTTIAKLQADKTYSKPVVTQVNALNGFYPAESYHQDYAKLHPYNPYIMINDAPKVAQLKKQMPQDYVDN